MSRKQRPQARRSMRLGVEPLEERLLLANWSGDIPNGTVWSNTEVQRIVGAVRIPAGSTLTIQPGTTIKFDDNLNRSILVEGRLIADGTSSQPILFTSLADDTGFDGVLGTADDRDTNGNGPSTGAAGNWTKIEFTATSTGSVMDNVQVRFGGDQGFNPAPRGAVVVNGGQLTLTNSVISQSEVAGLRVIDGAPTVTGTTFRNNAGAAIRTTVAANPAVSNVIVANNGIDGLAVEGGTVSGSVFWDDPDMVYWILGDVTVPAGATLTVGAGQVVKAFSLDTFADLLEINVQGRLVADGTPERPIIFTSPRDDSAGGDTDRNGPTAGFRGDWSGFRFTSTSSGNVINHVEIRYAGNFNTGSAVIVTGATLAVSNSVIRDTGRNAILARNNANVTVTNSVLTTGTAAGLRTESGATLTATNNTIDGQLNGVEVSAGTSVTLRNNLITNNTSSGIFVETPATVIAHFNDVFNPGAVNYRSLADQTNQNGNLSVDPRYVDRPNRQYRLRAGSPVTDAGTSDFAPDTDAAGNPRYDVPEVLNRGGGLQPFFDMGAFETQEPAGANADLATFGVSGPTTGSVGQTVAVSWTVQNLGTGTAEGPWTDAVYLSEDPVWDPRDRLLGRLSRTGNLDAGQRYNATTNVSLNGVLPGRYYFIVRTNDQLEAFEGLSLANNAGTAASPIDFALPTLTVGVPLAGSFNGLGQARYYQVTVAAGQTLTLTLDSAAASGVTELYIRRQGLPSRSEFDFRSAGDLRPDQSLVVPTTGPGTYYILAYANSGAAAASNFTLTARLATLAVNQVSPPTGSTGGRITLTIDGTSFTPNSRVSLVRPDGIAVSAETIQFADATRLYATFNLTGVPPTVYGVRVTEGAQTATAANAFTSQTAQPGHLRVNVIAPDRIRRGVPGTVKIEYENDGRGDLVAPVLVIRATNADLRHPGQSSVLSPSLELLAINPTGPAGVLPPGAKGSIDLPFLPQADGDVRFSVSQLGPSRVIDWNEAKAGLRPADVPSDAWDAIFTNFLESVGTTAGDYHAALARNATYLSQLGEYVSDVSRLLAFEIARAGNFGAIAQRYTLGALGRGIPDPTEFHASADATGNVTIRMGGRSRTFYRQRNGTFRGLAGDAASLTQADGTFRLRETDGRLVAFQANGQLAFIEDANGNRVTAVYSGGRLTELVDNFGDRLTYTYNAQGRITRITDPVGQVVTFGYDASGEHLTTITTPAGTTQLSYITGRGAPREHAIEVMTGPDGVAQFFEYDVQGRFVRTRIAGGIEDVSYQYLVPGGVTVRNAANESTTIYANDRGQPGIVEDPLGRITRYFYDADGHLVRTVAPDGSSISLGYDQNGNAKYMEDALGRRIDLNHDLTLDRLLSVRDQRGQTVLIGYDRKGNATSVTYPDGSSEQVRYDAVGNVVETTDRRGRVLRFTYNAQNLVTRKEFADGSSVSYTYDSRRNLLTITDARGTTSFQYDAVNRVTRVTYPNGRFLQFTYDTAGRRQRAVDQHGFTVNYVYDREGRLTEMTNSQGQRIAAYTYNNAGRLVREDRGNGTFTEYTYTTDGAVQSLVHRAANGSILARFDYTYDAQGRVTSMATLDGTTTYGYDGTGQLTTVNLPGGRTITYTYDAAGNRVSATDSGTTTNYTNNALNQVTAAGTATFGYDADGNLISRTDATGTTTYGYNDEGRLVSVVTPTDSYTYEYDSLGNRVAVVRNGVRTEYLVDPMGLGDVFAEYNGSQLTAHYTNGNGLTSRVDAAGVAAFYTFDGLGNTAQITGSSGAVLNRYSYLPFGEVLSQSGSAPNAFTFSGQHGVMSEGHGLYFMRNRYYDPRLGRFTSADPIGFAGGDTNLYGYVNNQPTGAVDPSGLASSGPLPWQRGNVTQPFGPGGPTRGLRPPRLEPPRATPPVGPAFTPGIGFIAEVFKTSLTLGEAVAIGLTGIVAIYDLASSEGTGGYNSALGWELGFSLTLLGGGLIAGVVTGSAAAAAAVSGGASSIAGIAGYGLGLLVRETNFLFLNSLAEAGFEFAYDTFLDPGQDLVGGGLVAAWEERGINVQQRLEEIRNIQVRQVTSLDPNDIGGPAGVGPQRHITGADPMGYKILFENKNLPNVIPAVKVVITHQLDPDLDWSTFEVGDFGFGDIRVEVPAGRRSYSTRVDARAARGVYVDVTVDVNLATGVATWTFLAIDPATGEAPTDPDAGFLPPNVTAPEGDGFADYTIRAKPSLSTGTTIPAQASIVFDDNAPLLTPVFTNTIDTGAPTSRVAALPATVAGGSFEVRWNGTDDAGGSGVGTYDVYVSDNGGPFTLWLNDTRQTSATFNGQIGHTYAFYCVATDNVGHQQALPAGAQATTRTIPPPPPAPAPAPGGVRAVAVRRGGKWVVEAIDLATGQTRATLRPFGAAKSKVKVQMRDVNNDAIADLICSLRVNGKLKKKVYHGVTLSLLPAALAK